MLLICWHYCSRQFCLGFNSLEADSILSLWGQECPRIGTLRQDCMVMERRDNACRVVLTSGRWSLMNECFSQLILEREILRSIPQALEEIPGGRKTQLVAMTMDTYYSFFSIHQSFLSLIPPSQYYHTSRRLCFWGCGESQEVQLMPFP